jgi:hypothetical protein
MRVVKRSSLGLSLIAVLFLVVAGCGASGGAKTDNLNGTWQNPVNQKKVVINLASEKKTIVDDDKALPVTIKPTEAADRYLLSVSDSANGNKDWYLSRIWDDTGKSFTLKVEREGRTEVLERVKG